MTFICPNCGGREMERSRRPTGRVYACRTCGYTGPVAIERDAGAASDKASTVYTPVLVLGLISTLGVAIGGSVAYSAGFFLVSSAVALFLHYFMRPDASVDDDLKSLDEEGRPLEKPLLGEQGIERKEGVAH